MEWSCDVGVVEVEGNIVRFRNCLIDSDITSKLYNLQIHFHFCHCGVVWVARPPRVGGDTRQSLTPSPHTPRCFLDLEISEFSQSLAVILIFQTFSSSFFSWRNSSTLFRWSVMIRRVSKARVPGCVELLPAQDHWCLWWERWICPELPPPRPC